MVDVKYCFNIYSQLNEWIDFCIILKECDYRDYLEAKPIVEAAYNEWMENDIDETIADYICARLTDNNYEYDVYFNEVLE